jgi:hypothetical protein
MLVITNKKSREAFNQCLSTGKGKIILHIGSDYYFLKELNKEIIMMR